MSNLIRAEFYRLKHDRTLFQMSLLSVVMGFVLIFIWNHEVVQQGGMFNKVNGINALSFGISSLMFVTGYLFSIFAVLYIINDYKNRTFAKVLSYGGTIKEIICSKMIVYLICIVFFMVIYISIITVFVTCKHGLGSSHYLYMFRLISIGILFNLATASLFAMVAFFSRNALITLVSPLIVLISFSYSFMDKTNILYYLPYVIGSRATLEYCVEFNYYSIVVKALISIAITFIITFGVSILWGYKHDFK